MGSSLNNATGILKTFWPPTKIITLFLALFYKIHILYKLKTENECGNWLLLTQTTNAESLSTCSRCLSSVSRAIARAVTSAVGARTRLAGLVLESDDGEEGQNWKKQTMFWISFFNLKIYWFVFQCSTQKIYWFVFQCSMLKIYWFVFQCSFIFSVSLPLSLFLYWVFLFFLLQIP